MTERKFVARDGRTWSVCLRPHVRRDEIGSHVTLEFATAGEIRVVSCRVEEWDAAEPDLASLLARALPSGASRHATSSGHDSDG